MDEVVDLLNEILDELRTMNEKLDDICEMNIVMDL